MAILLHDKLDYNSIPWRPYAKEGNTGIRNYYYEDDFIWIEFSGERIYLYTSEKIGKEYLLAMKSLAEMGKGLSSLISKTNVIKQNFYAAYALTATGWSRQH